MTDASEGQAVYEERDGRIEWDCGCVTWTEEGAFNLIACSVGCPVYSTTKQESEARGNRVIVKP